MLLKLRRSLRLLRDLFRRFAPVAVAGVLAALSMGCRDTATGSGANPEAASMRDSAGIAIVTTSVLPSTPRWTLPTDPEVELGAVEGAAPYVFAGIAFAASLQNERLVVANGASGELRFFDMDGTFLTSAGGRGAGPGEIREFSRIARVPGDTLVVYDITNRRITRFSADGSKVAEQSIQSAVNLQGEANRRPVSRTEYHVLTSGGRPEITRWRNLLFAGPVTSSRHAIAFSRAPERRPVSGDTARSEVHVFLIDDAGGDPVGMASLPGPLLLSMVINEGQRGLMPIWQPVPFAGEVLMATGGEHVVVSSTDRYQLQIYDASGRLRRLIRRADVSPVPVDDALRDRFLSWAISRPGARIESFERELARAAFVALGDTQTLPTHSDILVDDEARIWVRDPALPWDDDAPAVYTVFSPDGQVLATATVPGDLRVVHIGRDQVAAVAWDDLGIEYVRLYRIMPGN